MKNTKVRIGLFLCILVIGSGFFACPRMNTLMQSTESVDGSSVMIPSSVTANHSVKSTVEPPPPVPGDVDRGVVFNEGTEGRALKALQVIPAAKLKEQNYRAYVFRRYADVVASSGRYPSKRDSERYIQNELGPKLVSYLEAERKKTETNSQK